MSTILDRIVDTKRNEVAEAQSRRPLPVLRTAVLREVAEGRKPPRDFFAAVAAPSSDGVALIAEIKKASPSAGVIREEFDPVWIAQTYYRHGAAALSVLTDQKYFQGHLDIISAVKESVPLPVLRKDFIVSEYQIYESRAAGADALLLITEVLGPARIADFLPVCHRLGMTALVEVHTAGNLLAVLDSLGPPGPGRYILGINNRDLSEQRSDLQTTTRLAPLVPSGSPFVSESGIATRADVLHAQRAGARAILVGESLLRATDIGVRISELLGK